VFAVLLVWPNNSAISFDNNSNNSNSKSSFFLPQKEKEFLAIYKLKTDVNQFQRGAKLLSLAI
jgi:hypothetical protein